MKPVSLNKRSIGEKLPLDFKLLTCYLMFMFFNPQSLFPSIAPLRLALVTALLALLASVLKRRKDGLSFGPLSFQGYALIFFFIWVYIASHDAISPEICGPFVFNSFKSILFYVLLTAVIETPQPLDKFIRIIILFITINCTVTLLMGKLGLNPYTTSIRLESYFQLGGANWFALMLLSILPLQLTYLDISKSKSETCYLLFGVLASLACLLRTRSRMGIIGAILLLLLLLFSKRHQPKYILGLAMVCALLFATTHKYTWTRLWTSGDEWNVSSGDTHRSGRKITWRQALVLIKEYPVNGVGIGNFREAVKYHNLGRYDHVVHNMFLEVGAENGIPALLAYVSIIMTSLYHLWKAGRYYETVNPDVRMVAIAKGSLVGLGILCFCLMFLSIKAHMYYIYAAIAAVLNHFRKLDIERSSKCNLS